MKVLVAEDDDLLREFVKRCLNQHNIEVDSAEDGVKALQMLGRSQYNVAILDIEMPEMNGLEVCRRARQDGISTPILFLSSRITDRQRIEGLEAGADDYMIKPFSYEELIARLHAINRRPKGLVQEKIVAGDLVLEITVHNATLNNLRLNLTPKEFQLLEQLARNKNEVLKREYLLSMVWGIEVGNTSNRLESCIKNIRKKISLAGGKDMITTKHGVGYMLTDLHE